MWEAILPLAFDVGSSMLANKQNKDNINTANAMSLQSVREQMAFQERMARNAHQYEVEDLRKAGLNPILSAKYGGSATPSGASTTFQPVRYEDTLSRGISSAIDALRLKKELSIADTQNKKMLEEMRLLREETRSARASADFKEAEVEAEKPYLHKDAFWRRAGEVFKTGATGLGAGVGAAFGLSSIGNAMRVAKGSKEALKLADVVRKGSKRFVTVDRKQFNL